MRSARWCPRISQKRKKKKDERPSIKIDESQKENREGSRERTTKKQNPNNLMKTQKNNQNKKTPNPPSGLERERGAV